MPPAAIENVPRNELVPVELLSASVPLIWVLPFTVTLPAAIVNINPLLTVRLPMVIAVAGADMPELIMILSPAAGTPTGDQLAAVAQAVPVEVFVTWAEPSAANIRNDHNSKVCRKFHLKQMGITSILIVHFFVKVKGKNTDEAMG